MALDPMISYTALSRFLRNRAKSLRANGSLDVLRAEALEEVAMGFEAEERAVRLARERSYDADFAVDPGAASAGKESLCATDSDLKAAVLAPARSSPPQEDTLPTCRSTLAALVDAFEGRLGEFEVDPQILSEARAFLKAPARPPQEPR